MAKRVGHDIVAEIEIHSAAVERADLRQALGDVADALGGAYHIRALRIEGKGAFDVPEDQVPAHAGGEIEDDVDIGRTDAVGDFPVEIVAAAGSTRFRVADMAVNDRSTGLCRIDGGIGDLLGSDRHVAGFGNRIARRR